MTVTKLKCNTCHGKKKIMVLGGMKKTCPNCNGAGWVDIEETKGDIREDLKETKSVKKRKTAQKKKPEFELAE